MIDTRPAAEFATGRARHAQHSAERSFVTWAGWLVPYTADFYLIVDDGRGTRLDEVRRALALIGLDRVAGYFSRAAVMRAWRTSKRSISCDRRRARQAPVVDGLVVIDVRHDSEWNEGTFRPRFTFRSAISHSGSPKSPRTRGRRALPGRRRSSIAASLLKKIGRKHVANLTGGYKGLVSSESRVGKFWTVV